MSGNSKIESLRSRVDEAYNAIESAVERFAQKHSGVLSPSTDRSAPSINVWQCIVLAVGAFLLLLEAFYVPIRIFHHAGGRLVLVVEGLRYKWLPAVPANARVQTDLISMEILGTLLLVGVAFWLLRSRGASTE